MPRHLCLNLKILMVVACVGPAIAAARETEAEVTLGTSSVRVERVAFAAVDSPAWVSEGNGQGRWDPAKMVGIVAAQDTARLGPDRREGWISFDIYARFSPERQIFYVAQPNPYDAGDRSAQLCEVTIDQKAKAAPSIFKPDFYAYVLTQNRKCGTEPLSLPAMGPPSEPYAQWATDKILIREPVKDSTGKTWQISLVSAPAGAIQRSLSAIASAEPARPLSLLHAYPTTAMETTKTKLQRVVGVHRDGSLSLMIRTDIEHSGSNIACVIRSAGTSPLDLKIGEDTALIQWCRKKTIEAAARQPTLGSFPRPAATSIDPRAQ